MPARVDPDCAGEGGAVGFSGGERELERVARRAWISEGLQMARLAHLKGERIEDVEEHLA